MVLNDNKLMKEISNKFDKIKNKVKPEMINISEDKQPKISDKFTS